MSANQETLQPTHKNLYHIVKGTGRKNHWRKFGAGFVNADGSINVVIDLFPGQHFQLRDPQVEEAAPPAEEPTKKRTVKVDRSKKMSR